MILLHQSHSDKHFNDCHRGSIGLAHCGTSAYLKIINSHLYGSLAPYYALLTRMDAVSGVLQKLFWSFVLQVENWLQVPPLAPQPRRSQKPTFLLAVRQLVPGALMQIAPPLYVWHLPPQTLPTLLVQYVTIVFNALRLERVERSPRGSPWKVTWASVFSSQCMYCSMVIKLTCHGKWAMGSDSN